MKKRDILKGIHRAAQGGAVSSKFFMRHLALFVVLVTLALMYISVRFDCVTGMETISSLKRQLEVMRTATQGERSHYMSSTCESSLQAMVDTLHLGLSVQEQPPFRLQYDD